MRSKLIFKRTSIFIAALLWIIISLLFYWVVHKPNFLLEKPNNLFFIYPGTSFNRLQENLYDKGYIKDTTSFKWLSILVKYDKKILPGAYELHTDMNNWQAIKILRSGIQKPVNITLHNIHTKEELATKICQNINMKPAAFQVLLNDVNFLHAYGFTVDNILSMFIPNTYNVYWTILPQDLFKKMYQEYQVFWNKERLYKASQLHLTSIQVSILASIVEKETNKLEEASIIAGVYLNRLKRNMLLQADPTLVYIAKDPLLKRTLYTHIRIDSPYNTYLYKGLPPGPITMPSIASIEAVLNYTLHNYLYFVSKEDLSGYHYFSKTFEEHKKNAQKYRKNIHKKFVYK